MLERKPQRMVMLDLDEHETVLATLKAMHGLLVYLLCEGCVGQQCSVNIHHLSGYMLGWRDGREDALEGE